MRKKRLITFIVLLTFLSGMFYIPQVYACDYTIPGGDTPSEPPTPPPPPDPPPCDPQDPCADPESLKNPCPSGSGGEPVYLYTGKFYYRHKDLQISGRMPITIRRAYDTNSTYNSSFGYGWTFSYDIHIYKVADGTLLLRRCDASKDTFTPNGDDTYSGPADVHDIITLNIDGTYTLSRKSGSKYQFDINGCLTAIENRNGNQLLLIYDPAGKLPIHGISPYTTITTPIVIGYDYRLTRVEEAHNGTPTGRFVEFTYNEDGRIIKTADFANRETLYTYDESVTGDLISFRDTEGNLYNYAYDNNHLMTEFTDLGGIDCAKHINTYDSQNRVIRQTHGNQVIDIEYITPQQKTMVTTQIYDDTTLALLHTRIEYYEFNSEGYVTKFTRQLGGNDIVTSYIYYPNNRQVQQKTDAEGNTTDYTYYSNGNLETKKHTLSDGTVITTTYTYDASINRRTSKEISSTAETQVYRTEYTYYVNSNKKEERRILNGTTTYVTAYTYNNYGDILTITDPKGNVTQNEYNSYGFLTRTYDPNHTTHQTLYGYDNLGNRTSMTDANDNTTVFEYDDLNRITSITNSLGEEIVYTWEGPNLTQIEEGKIDAETGHITRIQYDDMNRKESVIKETHGGDITVAQYDYDSESNILKTTDANNNSVINAYDENCNLTSKTDANGATITYSYDDYNQLTTITYPDKAVNFTYNDVGNLLTYDDSTTQSSYTYDDLNRMENVTVTYPFGNKTVSYIYDRFGNRETVTHPDTGTTTYSYDDMDRLLSIDDIVTYAYDNASWLTTKTLSNGTATTYIYDAANRLTAITNPNVSYTHDNVGNRLTRTDLDGEHNYGYDNLYRLASTNHPEPQTDETYTYDKAGNRKTSTEYSDWTYNADNQLESYDSVSVTYDNNGNTTSKSDLSGATTYTWDYENRLIFVTTPDHSASYYYNPFGKRLSKTVDGTTTWYLYDQEDIVAEYDSSGSLLRSYIHGPGIDEPVRMTNEDTGNNYYYLSDGLGSIIQIQDESQSLVEQYKYDSFGNPTILDGEGTEIPESAISNSYMFTAREWDEKVSLYYYRARFYDSKSGRFLSQDPIKFTGGINFYIYVGNNPVNWVDPLGLAPECCGTCEEQKLNAKAYSGCVAWCMC